MDASHQARAASGMEPLMEEMAVIPYAAGRGVAGTLAMCHRLLSGV